MKPSRKKRILSIILLPTILLIIGLYLNSNREPLCSLANLTLSVSIVLVLLRSSVIVINGLFLKAFMLKFGTRLRFAEWLGLSAITTMGNFLTPFSGGLMVRATYLKICHGFPLTKFSALLAANYLIIYWVGGMAGLLTLLVFDYPIQRYWLLYLLFGGTVAGISAVMIVPRFAFPGKGPISSAINRMLEGLDFLKTDYALIVRIAFYTLVIMLLNVAAVWLLYRELGFPISLTGSYIVSLMCTLTPGVLGIQELLLTIASDSVNAGAGEGLIVSLLIRSATTLAAFAMGSFFSVLLARMRDK